MIYRPVIVMTTPLTSQPTFPQRKQQVDGGISVKQRMQLYRIWQGSGSNAAQRAANRIIGRPMQLGQLNDLCRDFRVNVLPKIQASAKKDAAANKKRKAEDIVA